MQSRLEHPEHPTGADDDAEIDFGSPYEPAYDVADDQLRALMPQPLAESTAGLPPEPREPRAVSRRVAIAAGVIAAGATLAWLISRGAA